MPPDEPPSPVEPAQTYPSAFPDEKMRFDKDKKPTSCRQCESWPFQLGEQQLTCDRTPKRCCLCTVRQIVCSYTCETTACLSCVAEFACDSKEPCARCHRLGQVCSYPEPESRTKVMSGERVAYEKSYGSSNLAEESSHQVPAPAGDTSGQEVVERSKENEVSPEANVEQSVEEQPATEGHSAESESFDKVAESQ